MAHGLWALIRSVGSALYAVFLYFAAILKNLTWPQVFLVFLLLFPRQIKNLLVSLNRLLEKMKTIHWGELKGDLVETSIAVEKAAQSQGARDKPDAERFTVNEAAMLKVMVERPSSAISIENPEEEYSQFLEEERQIESRLASLGIPKRRNRHSPIERFLSVSQAIEASLSRLYFLYGLQDSTMPLNTNVRRMAAGLMNVGVVTEEMYDSFGKYQRLRNRIVHTSAAEVEVKEAFLLGRRLYGLIRSIPLPEYRVVDPRIPVSDQPDLQDSLADVYVVLVEGQHLDKPATFLTTVQFEKGVVFVPMDKPNHRLSGYFYFSLDGQLRRIAGQGLELTILYSRK